LLSFIDQRYSSSASIFQRHSFTCSLAVTFPFLSSLPLPLQLHSSSLEASLLAYVPNPASFNSLDLFSFCPAPNTSTTISKTTLYHIPLTIHYLVFLRSLYLLYVVKRRELMYVKISFFFSPFCLNFGACEIWGFC